MTPGNSEAAQEVLEVRLAVLLSTTASRTAQCQVAGTVVTFPAGLTGDSCYLLAWGPTN